MHEYDFVTESTVFLFVPWKKVVGHHVPTRLRRQQGGGGVMFWAGIMGRELVGPFRVPEGVKITSVKNVEFLTDHFLPWYKNPILS